MSRLSSARQLKREQVEFRVITNEKTIKTNSNFKFLFVLSAVSVVLILVSLFLRVQLTELTEQINQETKKLENSEREELRTRSQLVDKMSTHNIEEQAIKLGMGKVQDYQVEYISIPRKDNVEVNN
ncbi:MAG: hypothetical protein II796_00745 [Oscillospiraceae bacterium]|nr:hypothetical protein [Oscillospiraceae bacterium]